MCCSVFGGVCFRVFFRCMMQSVYNVSCSVETHHACAYVYFMSFHRSTSCLYISISEKGLNPKSIISRFRPFFGEQLFDTCEKKSFYTTNPIFPKKNGKKERPYSKKERVRNRKSSGRFSWCMKSSRSSIRSLNIRARTSVCCSVL